MACCDEMVTQGWDAVYDEIDGMHKYKGIISLPCMTNKLLDDMMTKFTFRSDDVMLVSYPQSNFMWVQEMVYHLLRPEALDTPVKEKDALANRVPFMEHEFRNVDPIALLEGMEGPRPMKTHFPPVFFKEHLKQEQPRIVLWVQDPRDVIVNYHCFWCEKGDYFDMPKLDWDKFYDLFQKRALFEGDWMETNAAWLREFTGRDNFLLLRYEDAARDLEGTVRKLAKFLGVKCNGFKASRVAHMVPFDVRREWEGRWSDEQKRHLEERYSAEMKGTELEGVYVS